MAPIPTTAHAPMTREERKVIFASSLGTVFEWYDFYLYGALAPIIAKQFFAGICGGFHRPALWRAGVRSVGGHDWPQIHLLGHHPHHGQLDLCGRDLAVLRCHRCGGAGGVDWPAHVAGLGLGR